MLYGDRIKLVREALGKRPEEFATLVGITRQAVYQLEKSQQKIPQGMLENLAQENINIQWLITGSGDMFLNKRSPAETGGGADLTQVKLIDAKASAGPGYIVYEEGYSYISIPSELIRPYGPAEVEFIRVDGRSMEPEMHSGDILAIVRSPDKWVSERYFVLRMYGELRVKRLIRRANGLIAVISNNPEFGAEEITEEEFNENVDVIARVVKVIHAEDV